MEDVIEVFPIREKSAPVRTVKLGKFGHWRVPLNDIKTKAK